MEKNGIGRSKLEEENVNNAEGKQDNLATNESKEELSADAKQNITEDSEKESSSPPEQKNTANTHSNAGSETNPNLLIEADENDESDKNEKSEIEQEVPSSPVSEEKPEEPKGEIENKESKEIIAAESIPVSETEKTNSKTEAPESSQEKVIAEEKTEKDEESTAKANDVEDGDQDEEEEAQTHLDYSNYTKKQMVQVLESLLKEDDFSQVGRILKEIRKPYDVLAANERKVAYEKYIEDGGEKDGFEFRLDELDQRFNLAFNKLRERKNQYFNSLEKQKEHNLNVKLEILEKIRELVDSEETGTSIKALKDLQTQWKEVGVIPSSQVKSLWANYNALLDRFYDQRSIYFELKELDRKKNYDLKIELCEKAEQLSEQENIREVIKQLNELHEEFKHLGPVPKDEQEAVWERFKAASDKIYARRKEYYEKLKDELKINELAKEALVEKVLPFSEFNSERISDWNAKTKEIIAIQKEWESIGSLPKEKAKSINKQFWTSFKSFFNKKGQFFKKIEEERRSNLKLKQELVEKAEELKDSEDFRKTSDALKKLQRQWKEIGPVPEKFRNEVFLQFKKACDHFFERRRANSGKIEKEYEQNLIKKQALCDTLEKLLEKSNIELEEIQSLEKQWSEIGFVPKSSIKTIQNRYTDLIGKITDKIDIPEAEKHKLRFSAQFSNVNYGPGAEKFLHKKEGALRRQISALENDISVWKNNMDFFASSKNADKLKEDFQVKIDKANAQLTNLKEQLKIISNI